MKKIYISFPRTSRAHWVPLPVDNEGDVEAEDEGEGDGGQLLVAVRPQRLKHLTRLLPLK